MDEDVETKSDKPPVHNHLRIVLVQWSIIFSAIVALSVIFVELAVRTNRWVVLAFAVLYFSNWSMSKSIVQSDTASFFRYKMLSNSLVLLGEAVKIQSAIITDIQEFIKKLFRAPTLPPDMPIH